jgi:hypothetical protein
MHHRGHFKWIDGSGEAHWNFPISVDPETGAVDLLDREGLTGFPGVSQYLDLGAGSATYPLISVSGGWALTKEDLKSYLEDGERANLELAI